MCSAANPDITDCAPSLVQSDGTIGLQHLVVIDCLIVASCKACTLPN